MLESVSGVDKLKMKKEEIKREIISPDEKILVEFGIADTYSGFWIFLGIVILIISLIFIRELWLGLFLGLALIGYGFYLKSAYFYFLTEKRAIYYFRFFHTQLTSVDYQKITDLNVRENFLEKIFFASGDLAINTAGTQREEIILKHVANPHNLKIKLNEIKSSIKSKSETE